MAIDETPTDIEVTFRHVEGTEAIKEYALKKLSRVIYSLPNLLSASIEITFEDTKPLEQRYVVQATLGAKGNTIRAEDRGPDPDSTIDRVHDLLERRIYDLKSRVYFQKRREATAYKDRLDMEASALPPEDKTDLIARVKSHATKPMFPEDAVEQMELLGHDFYFFVNSDTGQHNVVYRRKAGGYGLIEPAISGAPAPELTGSEND